MLPKNIDWVERFESQSHHYFNIIHAEWTFHTHTLE